MARASQNAGISAIQGVLYPTLSAPTGLSATAVGSGGSFTAATYYWKISFLTPSGETLPSSEASAAIALNGSANLTWAAPPVGNCAVKIYRGTASNGEVLIATLPGNLAVYTDTGVAQAVSGSNTSGGTWYVDLSNADPTTSGATGLATTRQAVNFSAGTAAIPSVASNLAALTIPTAGTTAANYAMIYDASSAGNYRMGMPLASAVTAMSITIAVGALQASAS